MALDCYSKDIKVNDLVLCVQDGSEYPYHGVRTDVSPWDYHIGMRGRVTNVMDGNIDIEILYPVHKYYKKCSSLKWQVIEKVRRSKPAPMIFKNHRCWL